MNDTVIKRLLRRYQGETLVLVSVSVVLRVPRYVNPEEMDTGLKMVQRVEIDEGSGTGTTTKKL